MIITQLKLLKMQIDKITDLFPPLLNESLSNQAKQILGDPLVHIELADCQLELNYERAFEYYIMHSLNSSKTNEYLNKIKSMWIKAYFFALNAETLALTRGKYKHLVISGSPGEFNTEIYIAFSNSEKERLEKLIR